MSGKKDKLLDSDAHWWFCLRHHQPEYGNACGTSDRLGPYPDEATAARALEIVAERNAAADAYDAEWE
ncbi:MAG: hypothetical protein ACRDRL_08500 [Sciscionella sp.]